MGVEDTLQLVYIGLGIGFQQLGQRADHTSMELRWDITEGKEGDVCVAPLPRNSHSKGLFGALRCNAAHVVPMHPICQHLLQLSLLLTQLLLPFLHEGGRVACCGGVQSRGYICGRVHFSTA